MMASRWRWAVGFALGSVAAAGTARADAVRPWAGASASAGSTTNTGATATASDRWDRPATAYAYNYETRDRSPYQVPASGSSSARAGGPMGSLLGIDTRAKIANPGSSSDTFTSGGSSRATALWADDVIRITAPAGGTLPDQIQVRLSLTFDTPEKSGMENLSFGSLTARANGTKVTIVDPTLDPTNANTNQFDYVISNARTSVGRFHTNLNVNAAGESDPITLELAAENLANARRNVGMEGSHHAILGIEDLTFLDGTPLADRGYTVTYASAELVPEPASVLAWGGLTLGGAWLIRRRRALRAA